MMNWLISRIVQIRWKWINERLYEYIGNGGGGWKKKMWCSMNSQSRNSERISKLKCFILDYHFNCQHLRGKQKTSSVLWKCEI